MIFNWAGGGQWKRNELKSYSGSKAYLRVRYTQWLNWGYNGKDLRYMLFKNWVTTGRLTNILMSSKTLKIKKRLKEDSISTNERK